MQQSVHVSPINMENVASRLKERGRHAQTRKKIFAAASRARHRKMRIATGVEKVSRAVQALIKGLVFSSSVVPLTAFPFLFFLLRLALHW